MSCMLTLADSSLLSKALQDSHKRPIMNRNIIPAQFTSGICKVNENCSFNKGFRQQRISIYRKKASIIKAVAIPAASSPAESTSEYRKQICERYGFKKIGEPLPDNVTLKDIINSLPKKVVLE